MGRKRIKTAADLGMLPSVPLLGRDHLPACPAIYFVIGGDEILYVGRSRSLRLRWKYHDKLAELPRPHRCLRIAWLPIRRFDSIASREKQFIYRLAPAFNRTCLPPSPVETPVDPRAKIVFLNPEQAAKIIGVSRQGFVKIFKRGGIKAEMNIGRQALFSLRAVRALQKKRNGKKGGKK